MATIAYIMVTWFGGRLTPSLDVISEIKKSLHAITSPRSYLPWNQRQSTQRKYDTDMKIFSHDQITFVMRSPAYTPAAAVIPIPAQVSIPCWMPLFMMPSTAAASFNFGNGLSFGTGTPNIWHKGSHPSRTSKKYSLSFGTTLFKYSIWRS